METIGADFVFAEDYQLRPLNEVKAFIAENKHLPEIQSAQEMQENGISVSKLQTQLLLKNRGTATLYSSTRRKNKSVGRKSNKIIGDNNMKTNFCLIAFIALFCFSCKPINGPEGGQGDTTGDTIIISDSCLHSGIVVGIIGCKDTINDCFAQGYYIITDTSDSILTFSSDVTINTNYNGKTGVYYVNDYQIPYRFIYKYINPSDTNYIHFDLPFQNTMDPGMCYPSEHFKQAVIKRI